MKKPHLPWYEILSAGGNKPPPLSATSVVGTSAAPPPNRTPLRQPSAPATAALDSVATADEPALPDFAPDVNTTRRTDCPDSSLAPSPADTAAATNRPTPRWLVRPALLALRPLDCLLMALAFAMALCLAFVVGRYHPLPTAPQPPPIPTAQSLDEIRATRPVRFEDLQAFPAPQRRKKV